ncbi:MAG TPA: transposase [Terriglobia bacterium]|nr:transposase [Terriglobia bacterium]
MGTAAARDAAGERRAPGSLLAALEVQTGKVQSRCVARHTMEEFVRFPGEAVVGQRRKQIHLILDNLSTHKTAAVRAWIKRRPQVQFHFTPTYSSWLNQVEIRLGMTTRDGIRRRVLRTVPDLVSKLMAYVRLYNHQAQPFRWTYRNPRSQIHVSPLSVTGHSNGVQWGGVIEIRTHLSSRETTGASLTWTR